MGPVGLPRRRDAAGVLHRRQRRGGISRLDEAVAESPDGLARGGHADEASGVDDGHPVADLAHDVGSVRDDDDRPAFLLELMDPLHALLLEALVSDGQHLVDEEDVRVDVDGDGEAEPHVHARGVEAHLVVDERLQLGEGDDLVEAPLDLLPREAEQRGVEEDVVPARHLRLEAGAELQHGGQVTAEQDLAGRRLEDPGDALEEGRLSRAVPAEDPERLALGDLELDVAQRPELLEGDLAGVDDPLLQGGVLLLVEPEALGDVLDVDGEAQGRSELLGEVTLDPSEHHHREQAEQQGAGDDGSDADVVGAHSPARHHEQPVTPFTSFPPGGTTLP